MLSVTAEPDLDALADNLAGVLARPVADPLAPEWVVVVSAGMQRWLSLALSRRLGTSGGGRTDGVAANLELLFPSRLTRRLLRPDDEDPWELDRLVWAVLDVLEGGGSDEVLGPLTRRAPGVTRWGRARRLADLLDRYLLHRPGMVRAWAAGHDRDEVGDELPDDQRWQPALFRAVRRHLGVPSPPELLPERLAALRDGDVPDDVPERVSLFGLSTIPGGAPFLDVLDALGASRDVHLLLHQPSPALTATIRASGGEIAAATIDVDDNPVLRRRRDPTSGAAVHPLLRSWARPAREAAVLLGDRLPTSPPPPGGADGQATVLARLQEDLRADRAPAGDLVPPPDDRSVVVHSCHGPTRQVEVLRDQLLHLLADDPTLSEDDIVVLCPALEEFAPLLESILGPPAQAGGDDPHRGDGPPALDYRIADRSLGSAYPLLRALGAVVELLASRCSDAAVLDLVSLAPVRQRYGFTDADLELLADWVDDAGARWGLDGAHRQRWGIPAEHRAGTWRAALDRVLVGATTTDAPPALAVGATVPVEVRGGEASLAGRFADLVGRIARLQEAAAQPQAIDRWVALLRQVADELLAVDDASGWQRARLDGLLRAIVEEATIDGRSSEVALDLDDVRHLLGRRLAGTTGRSSFFRGGITVSSLTPLRGLRHRVVCLLGMDESAFSAGAPSGDDLTAADPLVGDRDRRADVRQSLLESVQAAEEHLIILRTGHSVVTNQPVPPAVAVAELTGAIRRTLAPTAPDAVRRRLEVVHPRQRFDERSFAGASALSRDLGIDGPFSFDPLSCAGARARTAGATATPAPFAEPVTSTREASAPIALEDLRELLDHAPRWFLRRSMELQVPRPPEDQATRPVRSTTGGSGLPRAAAGRELVLQLGHLEQWRLRQAYLEHRRAGGAPDAFLARARAGDLVPPGRLAEASVDALAAEIDPIVDRLAELGALDATPVARPIDLALPDGTRIVGSVLDAGGHRPGPIAVSVSRLEQKHRLGPWLELLALTAQEPTVDWQAVVLHRTSSATKKLRYDERILAIEVADPAQRRARAVAALEVLADLLRRARHEPLPLFPKLSWALHRGTSPTGPWLGSPGKARGDADDEWTQLAFARASLDEITSLPLRADDPPGEGADRATRFAHVLWGALETSLAPADEEEAR